jgi:hypothetical protein
LLRIAEHGMSVPVAKNFVPNGSAGKWPRLRSSYKMMPPAVHKLLADTFIQKRLAVVLPKGRAGAMKRLAMFPVGWAANRSKKKGRPIINASARDGGCTPLNTKEAKKLCDKVYGRIRHPTIQDLARQIMDFFVEARERDPSVRWKDITLFKMDLAGAYTLISFDPEEVCLMGSELAEDRVMFYLCGFFGWTGTPAAFQVVTRACLYELRKLDIGCVTMYVDDVMGVCFIRDLEHNFRVCREFLEGLLGAGAVALEKSSSGMGLVEIGYQIDLGESLEQARVSVSEENMARSLVGFLRGYWERGRSL